MVAINFFANEHEDLSRQPIPAGDYLAYVEASEMKISDDGTQKLSLTVTIMSPEQYQGRKVWVNCTLASSNTEHVKYGSATLAQICKAVGVLNPHDSEELHNIPFSTRITNKQAANGEVYSNANVFWSASSQAPPPPKPKPSMPGVGAPANRAPQAPAQPWQQPATYPGQGGQPAQVWQPQVPQAPQQQQMDLQTQYRTQPPQQPQQAYQPPAGAPPWAQQQPPQQQPTQADAPHMYPTQQGDGKVPY